MGQMTGDNWIWEASGVEWPENTGMITATQRFLSATALDTANTVASGFELAPAWRWVSVC